jgi:hypothetical protein
LCNQHAIERRGAPQNVIHGFRTVVGDFGANIAYVVSLNGFQAKAHEARDPTNVELLPWTEFQIAFVEMWFVEPWRPSAMRSPES